MTASPSAEPLTDQDHDVLTFCEQHWNLSGSLPTLERAQELGLAKAKYEKALLKTQFQAALAERGIVLRNANEPFKARLLTAEQLAVANTLLDLTDTRSQKKKLQDLNVSTVKYQAWLKDPVFRRYLQDRAEATLDDNAHEVNMALMDSVRSGNVKAIEYYNEITGRFVPMSRRGSSHAPNVDTHTLITRIIEIIQKRVKDPALQGAIGQDLRNLIEANHMASQLTGGTGQQNEDYQPEALQRKKELESKAPKPEPPIGNNPLGL